MIQSVAAAARRNAIALLALFVALGGTAFAATALPKNSVGSKQLKANAVTSAKIKKATIVGSDVKNGSLTGAAFAGGTAGLKGDTGAQGPQGAVGAQGPQGPQGVQGAAGTARAYAFFTPSVCSGAPVTCAVSKAKNVASATRISTGFYCLAVPGLRPSETPSMATVEYGSTIGVETATSALTLSDGFPGCPNGTADFAVVTQRLTTATADSPDNNVAFTFLVP